MGHGSRQFYATSKGFIKSKIDNGLSVLLDIDVQGAEKLKKAYVDDAVTIFIAPPSLDELVDRLHKRGTDDEQTINLRVKNARNELAKKDLYDYLVINDNFDTAYRKLHKIIEDKIGVSPFNI